MPIDRKSSHRNPDKKAVSTNVKIRTKKQIIHVMYFSHLVRNPDKKDFMTRGTVSITAFSGQNSDPPPVTDFFISHSATEIYYRKRRQK